MGGCFLKWKREKKGFYFDAKLLNFLYSFAIMHCFRIPHGDCDTHVCECPYSEF